MSDVLQSRTGLATLTSEPLRSRGSVSAVRLVEQPLGVAYTLRFLEVDEETIDTIAALTGLHLATTARAVTVGSRTALWLGPGDWLVRFGSDATVPQEWDRMPSGRYVAIDTSDLWFTVRLDGVYSRDVLAKGCALDFDPARFPPSTAAVTQLARIRALIHHVEGCAYDVYVERSYAAYVWTWLDDAVQEFLQ